MAKKKKEEQRFLGQMPLPNSRKRYKVVRKAWNGLNRRITTDSGELSNMVGMSTKDYPYLVPAKVLGEHGKIKWQRKDCQTLGISGFDDFLVIIYRKDNKICLDYITSAGTPYTANWDVEEKYDNDNPRYVVQFNVLDDILNPVGSGVTKKLIILPDKKTIDFNPIPDENNEISASDLEVKTMPFTNETANLENEEERLTDSEYLKNIEKADRRYVYKNEGTGNCYEWYRDTEADIAQWQRCETPVFPDLDYATVSHGRLFGVGRGRIYASGFNDYSNWTFDSVDEYNEANAWCSSAQANTKADGEFTGITSYQGHVLAFKKDITYEIYNTKNPFRVIDIYGDGAIDNRTIQEVNGNLFFVSKGAVHIYTGSVPKPVSYKLGIDVFMEENDRDDIIVSGTDGRNYYLWISRWDSEIRADREIIYVYDTFCGQWSVLLDNTEVPIKAKPVGIATNKNGIFFLRSVYDNASESYGDLMTFADVTDQSKWCFETDLMTNESYDIKHLKKVQLRAEADNGAFTIKTQYSDGKEEQEVYNYATNTKDDIIARFIPRTTAAYGIKLRFEGSGYVRFHNLELIYEDGGEVNVTL